MGAKLTLCGRCSRVPAAHSLTADTQCASRTFRRESTADKNVTSLSCNGYMIASCAHGVPLGLHPFGLRGESYSFILALIIHVALQEALARNGRMEAPAVIVYDCACMLSPYLGRTGGAIDRALKFAAEPQFVAYLRLFGVTLSTFKHFLDDLRVTQCRVPAW